MSVTFTQALEALKVGRPIARAFWEDRCWLILNTGLPSRGRREWHPVWFAGENTIQLCTQNSPHAVAWKPTQDDLLAEDWIIR